MREERSPIRTTPGVYFASVALTIALFSLAMVVVTAGMGSSWDDVEAIFLLSAGLAVMGGLVLGVPFAVAVHRLVRRTRSSVAHVAVFACAAALAAVAEVSVFGLRTVTSLWAVPVLAAFSGLLARTTTLWWGRRRDQRNRHFMALVVAIPYPASTHIDPC